MCAANVPQNDSARKYPADIVLPILPMGTPPQLSAAIADGINGVLHRHGVSAFIATRNAAIAHEAAHAIVGTHEGFTIREITIYSRSTPLGLMWSGRCKDAHGPWTTGPDSSVEDDLRYARFIIAGLAGEAMTRLDKPGSSIDELGLSQLIGMNIANKIADPALSHEEYHAYAEQLWHEQVWHQTLVILHTNSEPFLRLAQYLDRKEHVHSKMLRKLLAQVKRIAP